MSIAEKGAARRARGRIFEAVVLAGSGASGFLLAFIINPFLPF